MENPVPFDLNLAIRRWQEDLAASPAFCADNLEELASHLRASVERLRAEGVSEEEAFHVAVGRIGERGLLAVEYAKTNLFVPWSLAVLAFSMVAVMYLFQVIYSMIWGILCWLELLHAKDFRRLIAQNPALDQLYQAFSSHYHPPGSFAVTLTLVLVLVLILAARLVAGRWKRLSACIQIFKRPIRAALSLGLFGVAVILLPDFLSDNGGSTLTKSALALDGFRVSQATVNVVLVLCMVLFARRGSRKIALTG